MAPYVSNGDLTTDKRVVDDTTTWDAQSDWDAYQSANDVVVNNGVIELAERQWIDNFETDPDGPYASDSDDVDAFYGGNLNNFTRDSTISAYEGTFVLEGTSSGGHNVIGSTTGLAYPAPGDNFAARVQITTSNARTGPFWAVQGESGGDNISGYQAWLSTADGELILYMWEDGTSNRTTLAQSAASYPEDEWLDVQIEWGTDGSISVTVLDSSGSEIASVSATDSTFTSGGIGWHVTSSGSTTSYFDEYRLLQ